MFDTGQQGSISPTYLCTTFMHVAPKSVIIQSSCQYLFSLLGSSGENAAHRNLMKLRPVVLKFLINYTFKTIFDELWFGSWLKKYTFNEIGKISSIEIILDFNFFVVWNLFFIFLFFIPTFVPKVFQPIVFVGTEGSGVNFTNILQVAIGPKFLHNKAKL